MNSKIVKNLLSYAAVIIGNAIVAFGVCFFVLPQNLIMGGVTGIGMIASHYTNWDIALVTYGVNIFFFIIGLIIMGKKFALGIIISTLTFPAFLYIFKSIPNMQYDGSDIMLATIFAGILIGAGGGIILRNGASSGGIEVLSVVINSKTGVPLALLINLVDVIILAFQLSYSSVEQILYGVLLTCILAVVLDKVLLIGEKKTQVTIISPEYQSIRKIITKELDLGCTMLDVSTGFGLEKQQAVMCVLSRRKLSELHNTVLEIDPKAFIITAEVNNVKGRGFSLPKLRK